MDALKREVAGTTSGGKLIKALESSSLAGSSVPGLITSVIREIKGQYAKPGNGSIARPSLDSALCVIKQLSFVAPRWVRCCLSLLVSFSGKQIRSLSSTPKYP
jgi:hypothetical protein